MATRTFTVDQMANVIIAELKKRFSEDGDLVAESLRNLFEIECDYLSLDDTITLSPEDLNNLLQLVHPSIRRFLKKDEAI